MKRIYKIEIYGLFGRIEKSSCENLILIGECFINNVIQTPDHLKEYLCAYINGDFEAALRKINGFFSVILHHNESIYLISDKLRTRPFFYSNKPSKVISDNFYSIFDNSDQHVLDYLSCEEYLHTGYVTGCETLAKNIYQVEAAQIVKIDKKGELSRKNYWYFVPERNLIKENKKEYWYKELDTALKQATERLLKLANGKQIVIPLSGGYDSRAIALYLKKSGYKNIICFTFGRNNSHEVAMSQRIAKALDLEWHNVEYTRAMWDSIKISTDFSDYIDRISSGVSVANIQVYPAVKNLVQKGVINKDAIVVPGHTGDFVSGGHFTEYDLDRSVICDYAKKIITKRHYNQSKDAISHELFSKISCSDFFNKINGCNVNNEVVIAEAWECRERQSKFISNSNRYYDFFGLSWWMPFWDNDFIDVWEKVPYELRLNTVLWNDFVNEKMVDFAGVAAPIGRSDAKKNIIQKIKNALNYFTDPNDLYALVPFYRWFLFRFKISKKSGTVFGFLSESYIRKLEERLER